MFDWVSVAFATIMASIATVLFLWLLQITLKTLFEAYKEQEAPQINPCDFGAKVHERLGSLEDRVSELEQVSK